ncbi:hypothetical protein DESPIG_00717 [Desulfovibrio piger ATCC 29098]|uniref:Uncharacterized protein n=1 Tax=Desulfovibrio piger ATCC 29098 TaxID=411464 RepID=B6WRM6_9BACT|nr:hypothetical protein DESPIG_00717 [Desulfovibrio piger ATCC 29098]
MPSPCSPIGMNGRARNVLLRPSSLCVFTLPAGPSGPPFRARDCVLRPSAAICGTESVEKRNSHFPSPFPFFLFSLINSDGYINGEKKRRDEGQGRSTP